MVINTKPVNANSVIKRDPFYVGLFSMLGIRTQALVFASRCEKKDNKLVGSLDVEMKEIKAEVKALLTALRRSKN